MDRRVMLAAPLGLLAIGGANAQGASLRSRVLGAWSLKEAVTVRGDVTIPWFGRKPPITGLIIYHESGWMSVQIVGARPEKTSRKAFDDSTPEERQSFLEAYYAYYGRFAVDEENRTVSHTISDSLLLYEKGTVLKRSVEFDADTLTLLTEPRTEAGITVLNRLAWKRIL